MGEYAFLVYIGCIILILIIGKLFLLPIKKIFKLVINSIIGGILIYVINIIGSGFNFHIGLNWLTILCSGFLGIPGVILLIILKIFSLNSNFFQYICKKYKQTKFYVHFAYFNFTLTVYIKMYRKRADNL